MWISNVDRPGHGLMQIIVSDVRLWRLITRLLVWVAWLLVAWVYRMVVVDTSLPMFNLDSNVIRVSTSKGNCCRSIMLSLN